MAAVEAMEEQKHLFPFFCIIVKKTEIPHWLKQEEEAGKTLQLWGDVRIHKNPPLLGMPLMAPSSDKEGNLSA